MSVINTSNVNILNTCPKDQATDFWQMLPCPNASNQCQIVYASTDPRTRDMYNNTTIPYDRPPYQSTVDGLKFSDVYENPKLGKNMIYDSYANIDIGDYTYYVDPTNQTPYLPDVYTLPSEIIPMAYQDPISRVKWEYVKIPLNKSPTVCQEANDRITFREDLMSLQSIPMNRSLYSLVV